MIPPNDREITPETVKKEALKELTALCPYNFLDDTEYKVYLTDTGKILLRRFNTLLSLTRVPIGQQYATTKRFTAVRLPAEVQAFRVTDTILTGEPVANAEFANAVGESKGTGINNLSEEEMDTLTQETEEMLLKKAFSIKNSKGWATEHDRPYFPRCSTVRRANHGSPGNQRRSTWGALVVTSRLWEETERG
jgi:hypothetical protein